MNDATRRICFSLAALLAVTQAAPVFAADTEQAEIQDLKAELQQSKAQMQAMQKQIDAMVQMLMQGTKVAAPAANAPVVAVAGATTAPGASGQGGASQAGGTYKPYFEHKPGKSLTFITPGGEITGYGNFDLSLDVATKGIANKKAPDGSSPVGIMGWQPDISTNLSYIGVRGFQNIKNQPFQFIYQFETQIEISATSGTGETGSSESNVVKGGLTSRNTFVGLRFEGIGSFMVGKTDAPYKVSTSVMNPFYGMIGDYAAIMGNTGGDNRVEFGTRLDHSIWFESVVVHGFQANLLYSPGQNRASDSSNIAAGESDLTGGNIPGSGGSIPIAGNDGSFSDAVSGSITYKNGPLYLIAAYERHMKVNRSSDLTGIYANVPDGYMAADTADEDAAKIGAEYSFPTRTKVMAVFESLHRYVPSFLEFQNERQRTGTWLAVSQEITGDDSIYAGWAHAGRTPGDPGQHNTSLILPPLGSPGDATGGPDVDNAADMLTFAYKHNWGSGLSSYVNLAGVFNGPYAHYAMGPGGRAVTIDGHDAFSASGGTTSDPHCWAGGQILGVSSGLKYQF